MLKNKLKIFVCIFSLIVLIANLSFATTEPNVEPEAEENATLTSENPEENIVTTDEQPNPTTDDGTETTSDESYYQNLISDDLYKFEDNIEVNNLIDGNAYLFGTNVTINGQIGGDMFVVAQNVNLTQESYVYGNLFVVADNITIDGIVCDLYSVSQKLDITENGAILRDIRSVSGNISINGNIGRNTHLNVGNLVIGENAVIYGNLNYETSKAITVPEGIVSGDINFTEKTVSSISNNVIDYVISWVTTLLFTLVVFGLLLLFTKKFTLKVENAIHKNMFATLGIGVLAFIIIVIALSASLSLLLTAVGTSLAFVLGLLSLVPLTIANTLSVIAIANLLGSKVKLLGKAHNLLAVIIVTTIIWALELIPFYVGLVVSTLVMVFGLGLFARAIFTRKEKENSENVISE